MATAAQQQNTKSSRQQGKQHGERAEDTVVEKLVDVRRVAKTVKGGRNMRFAALMVAGDSKGRVGYGTGKAREVPEAIRKASEQARREMKRVPLRNGKTLHHDVVGKFGAATVVLRSAPPGTGIIAGGPMRAVFEALGIQDVVAKSLGTSNPNNMVKATFNAFDMFESPRHVGSRRGMKVSDVLGKKRDQDEQQAGSAKPASAKTKKKAESKTTDADKPEQKKETAKKSAKKSTSTAKKTTKTKTSAASKKTTAKKSSGSKSDSKKDMKKDS